MDGSDVEPPVPFVPPHADARGLIVVDDVAYVATTGGGCGKAPAGIWALDLGTRRVTTWRAPVGAGGIAGEVGLAIGSDGTIYVATTSGELVALEPRTLVPKGTYRSGGAAFTSSPIILEQHGTMLIAAATRDGRIHLLDGARLTSVSAPASAPAGLAAGALVSWADSGATRWLLAPGHDGVGALKVVDQNGAPAFQSGWMSRDMTAPLGAVVINGVIFVVSGGGQSRLYAFDGVTGQELWNSGTAMASIARGLSGESGQVYVGTNDGTLYAFGFPMEH
jgi:outer membrane protein assembly factor BamB